MKNQVSNPSLETQEFRMFTNISHFWNINVMKRFLLQINSHRYTAFLSNYFSFKMKHKPLVFLGGTMFSGDVIKLHLKFLFEC